ncbi:MAG: type II secretion system protein [Phycisphaerae bacterium]
MLTRRFLASCRAFSLIELLVVVSIVALLIGILMPALSMARTNGVRVKCLTNLQAIGQAFQTYASDDGSGYLIPVHALAEGHGWRYDGEYEYGGVNPSEGGVVGGIYSGPFGPSTRPLNKYIYGDVSNLEDNKLFRCPGDVGLPDAPKIFDPALPAGVPIIGMTGTSYRVNNHIKMYTSQYFHGPYMRPGTRVPESSTTVLLAETIAQVAIYNPPPYIAPGWHLRPMNYNVTFADGHSDTISIRGGNEPNPATSYWGDYWIFRGENWRLDCWPEARIYDKP